jgi:Cu/Ag efflux protein CusF
MGRPSLRKTSVAMSLTHRACVLAAALLMAGTAAQAQSRGGGGRGGKRGGAPPTTPSTTDAPARPKAGPVPTSKIDIIGVVKQIAPAGDRVTIAYEEADALNWPAGTNTFVVAKTELLKDVTAGEKVRFRLDSQEISYLAPF